MFDHTHSYLRVDGVDVGLGPGTAWFELRDGIVVRQVERYGAKWFDSYEGCHPEIAPGLGRPTLDDGDVLPGATSITPTEFSAAWKRSGTAGQAAHRTAEAAQRAKRAAQRAERPRFAIRPRAWLSFGVFAIAITRLALGNWSSAGYRIGAAITVAVFILVVLVGLATRSNRLASDDETTERVNPDLEPPDNTIRASHLGGR